MVLTTYLSVKCFNNLCYFPWYIITSNYAMFYVLKVCPIFDSPVPLILQKMKVKGNGQLPCLWS